MDMVRCMLKAKQIPREFLVEVVATTIYILNRFPTKNLHLRVFGCITYAHVPNELRKKLDDKGEMCIFIRYNTNLKAYKFYNLEKRR
ncbi:hypothetical protein CR513_22022, partial [Mucuna pruriens]